MIVGRTFTNELALSVDALSIQARLRTFTLVYVGTIASRIVKLISFIALASKHAKNIFAASEYTQVVEHLTFIYVNTRGLAVIVGMHESHFALAAKGARVVEAVAVLAQTLLVQALVHVLARVAVALEAAVAHTLERSVRVNALGILVTSAIVGETLVDISTVDSVAIEAIPAPAGIGTRIIDAIGVVVALGSGQFALVVVGASVADGVRFHRIAELAVAHVRANRVVAFALAADLLLFLAFVHIQTRSEVDAGEKALGAVTHEAAGQISAVAAIADARILCAFVQIVTRATIQRQSVATPTSARETSRRINTCIFAATVMYIALIYILAMRF